MPSKNECSQHIQVLDHQWDAKHRRKKCKTASSVSSTGKYKGMHVGFRFSERGLFERIRMSIVTMFCL